MIGANKSVSKKEEKRKCDVKRSSRIQLCDATNTAASLPLPPPPSIITDTFGEGTKGGIPLKCECSLTTVDRVKFLEARQT